MKEDETGGESENKENEREGSAQFQKGKNEFLKL